MPRMTLEGLIGATDSLTQTFLTQTYPQVAGLFEYPIYLLAVISWAVYGLKIYFGRVPADATEFAQRAAVTVGVFSTLHWGGVAGFLYRTFYTMSEAMASTVMAGQPTAKMLDALITNAQAVSEILRAADFYQWAMILDGFLIFVLNCGLFLIAAAYMILSRWGLTITMVFLPLFASFLLIALIRGWFTNWLSKMLFFAVLYILVVVIVRVGYFTFGEAITEAGKIAGGNLEDMLITSEQTAQLVLVESLLIVFMLMARGWAASLSGGAASSSGMLMMVARTVMVGPGRYRTGGKK